MANTEIEKFLLPETSEIELELPSGMPVTFKRPSLAFFLALGTVPGRVANAVLAAHKGEISEEAAAVVKPDPDEEERRAEIAVVYCLAKPKFSFTPGPGEHDVRRMRPIDKLRVYKWAMESGGGGVDLASFREKPSGEVPAPGPDRQTGGTTPEWVPVEPGVGVGS